MSRLSRNILRLSLAVIIAAVCLLPAVLLAPRGICRFDEPYQMLNTLDWRGTALAPLSALCGAAYASLTGGTYLAFRYFALGCAALSIIAGAWWMWRRTGRYRASLGVGAFCLFMGVTNRSFMIWYGWDSLTVLTVALSGLLLLDALRRQTLWRLGLLGLLTAVAFLVRVPNIALLAVVTGAMAIYAPRGRRLRPAIFYICMTLAFSILGLSFLYGSPMEWLRILISSPVPEHSLRDMTLPVLEKALFITPAVVLLWGVHHLIRRTLARRHPWRTVLVCGGAALMFFYFLRRGFMFPSGYAFMALFSLAVAAAIYYGRHTPRHGLAAVAVIVAAVALVPCAGSNCDLDKVILWPLFPPLMALLWPRLRTHSRVFMALVGSVLLVFTYFQARYVSRTFGYWEDYDDATELMTDGPLRGMYTSPGNAGAFRAVAAEMRALTADGSEPLVLRGYPDGYIYEYVLGLPNPFMRNRFDFGNVFGDPDYLAWTASRLESPVTVLYIIPHTDGISPMQDLLQSRLHPVITTDRYIIYKN